MSLSRRLAATAALAGAALRLAAADGAVTGIVLTTDRTVDCTSHHGIAAGVWHDGMNDQQKAYAMWRFFIARDMHLIDAGLDSDGGNASEHFVKTGYCVCGQWASLFSGCMADNGMVAGGVGLNGHNIDHVDYWGDSHSYDIDMQALYVRPDGVVANPTEVRHGKLSATGEPAFRAGAPVKSYPWYLGPDSVAGSNGLYSQVHIYEPVQAQATRSWNYDLALRPGQEITWSWFPDPDVGFVALSCVPNEASSRQFASLREYLAGDFDYYTQSPGKPAWSWGYRRGGLHPGPLQTWNGTGGNGRLTMDLGADGFADAQGMAVAWDNLAVHDGALALADAAKPGSFALEFRVPYVFGDAWIEKPLPATGLTLAIDGVGEVYPGGRGVDDGKRIRLFDAMYRTSAFTLRATLAPGSAPLRSFRAVGAFYLCHAILPALLPGPNEVRLRVADAAQLGAHPLHATYVYDQMDDHRQVMRVEREATFTPQRLTATIDTGARRWPLMREIRLRCGGRAPLAAPPTEETAERDWAAYPWPWIYHGVNFWNDFERGDRCGWVGTLTSERTSGGSAFALADSLRMGDGSRQLKMIRFGAFLDRGTRFRCRLWVKGVAKLNVYTRDQDEQRDPYYGVTLTDLKDGEWQTIEVAMNDCVNLKDATKRLHDDRLLANIYLQAIPADGVANADVGFVIDDTVCYDGELHEDPCADAEAPDKALARDPIWNARPPGR